MNKTGAYRSSWTASTLSVINKKYIDRSYESERYKNILVIGIIEHDSLVLALHLAMTDRERKDRTFLSIPAAA